MKNLNTQAYFEFKYIKNGFVTFEKDFIAQFTK